MGVSAAGTGAYWMSSCKVFTISTETLMTRLPESVSLLAATPLLIYRLPVTELNRADSGRYLEMLSSGRWVGQ